MAYNTAFSRPFYVIQPRNIVSFVFLLSEQILFGGYYADALLCFGCIFISFAIACEQRVLRLYSYISAQFCLISIKPYFSVKTNSNLNLFSIFIIYPKDIVNVQGLIFSHRFEYLFYQPFKIQIFIFTILQWNRANSSFHCTIDFIILNHSNCYYRTQSARIKSRVYERSATM